MSLSSISRKTKSDFRFYGGNFSKENLFTYLFTFTMSAGKKITYVGYLVFFKMLAFLVKQIGITLRQTLTYPTALSLTTDQNST